MVRGPRVRPSREKRGPACRAGGLRPRTRATTTCSGRGGPGRARSSRSRPRYGGRPAQRAHPQPAAAAVRVRREQRRPILDRHRQVRRRSGHELRVSPTMPCDTCSQSTGSRQVSSSRTSASRMSVPPPHDMALFTWSWIASRAMSVSDPRPPSIASDPVSPLGVPTVGPLQPVVSRAAYQGRVGVAGRQLVGTGSSGDRLAARALSFSELKRLMIGAPSSKRSLPSVAIGLPDARRSSPRPARTRRPARRQFHRGGPHGEIRCRRCPRPGGCPARRQDVVVAAAGAGPRRPHVDDVGPLGSLDQVGSVRGGELGIDGPARAQAVAGPGATNSLSRAVPPMKVTKFRGGRLHRNLCGFVESTWMQPLPGTICEDCSVTSSFVPSLLGRTPTSVALPPLTAMRRPWSPVTLTDTAAVAVDAPASRRAEAARATRARRSGVMRRR